MAEMGIDLGSGKAFVAQHFLHGTEVGTILHQFCCETVAEAVGRNVLVQACLLDSLLDELKDGNAGEMVTAKVEKNIFLFAGLRCELAADGMDIVIEQMQGMGVDGYPSLFVALAYDLEHFLLEIDVGEFEIDQFGDAKTTTIKHFDDDVVAGGTRKTAVKCILNSRYILVGEHVGQMHRTVGHVDQFSGIFGNDILDDQHLIEGAQAREKSALASDGYAGFVEFFEQTLDMNRGDILRFDTQRLDIVTQMLHIAQIGLHRVVGQVAFQTQMCLKVANIPLPVHDSFNG